MTNLIMPHGSNELNTLYIEDELARASMLSAAAEMEQKKTSAHLLQLNHGENISLN